MASFNSPVLNNLFWFIFLKACSCTVASQSHVPKHAGSCPSWLDSSQLSAAYKSRPSVAHVTEVHGAQGFPGSSLALLGASALLTLPQGSTLATTPRMHPPDMPFLHQRPTHPCFCPHPHPECERTVIVSSHRFLVDRLASACRRVVIFALVREAGVRISL